MHFHFPIMANCGREGGNKKAATTDLIAARDEPIRLIAGIVNRVMRIGAFSWGQPKKLPWKRLRTELIPVKGLFPQRACLTHVKADCTSGVYPRATDARCEIRYNCTTILPLPSGDECDLGSLRTSEETGLAPRREVQGRCSETRMKHLGSRLAKDLYPSTYDGGRALTKRDAPSSNPMNHPRAEGSKT